MEVDYQRTSRVLKALSDPKRLRIVHLLRDQEMCASNLLDAFDISQPTLSHDMHVLVAAGLVSERRSGKNVLYRADRQAIGEFLDDLYTAIK